LKRDVGRQPRAVERAWLEERGLGQIPIGKQVEPWRAILGLIGR